MKCIKMDGFLLDSVLFFSCLVESSAIGEEAENQTWI